MVGRGVLGIAVERGRLRAVALRRGRVAWAGEASYDGEADLIEVLTHLATDRPRGMRFARIALDPEVSRLKVLERLPALSAFTLASHVALQPKRYFLMNGIPLVTDAVRVHDGIRRRSTIVLAGAAPEPLIAALTTGLRAAGLEAVSIAPAAAYRASTDQLDRAAAVDSETAHFRAAAAAALTSPVLNLQPQELRAARLRQRRRSMRFWALACAISWILAAAAHAVGLWRAQRRANLELDGLSRSAAQALRLRADLAATSAALAQLHGYDAGRVRPAVVLADIARALPDSAFVTALRLDERGGGVIVGFAPSAGGVARRLAGIAGFREVRLEGPVTREVVDGLARERFAIRFSRVPG